MVSLQVLPHSHLIFPSKTWFLKSYLNFQWQKSLKNSYFSHPKSKSHNINFIKFELSRSFQKPPMHITIPSTWIEWSTFKQYHVLNWFFLPKPGFLEFIWIFSGRNHLKINISHILNPNLTKQIPLNPAHQDLFNNTKGTSLFLQNFQLRFEEIIQYSRTFALQIQTTGNQADAALLLESFPKRLRMRYEASWFSGSHQYKTNKLPCFTDRWFHLHVCSD
jgi:hypothetical protein